MTNQVGYLYIMYFYNLKKVYEPHNKLIALAGNLTKIM